MPRAQAIAIDVNNTNVDNPLRKRLSELTNPSVILLADPDTHAEFADFEEED
ncbi:MAG: hypothetical protein Q4D93_02645 [Porphyromonas sp.]|nr:hypothetical protein [Porphyromonas sp.]